MQKKEIKRRKPNKGSHTSSTHYKQRVNQKMNTTIKIILLLIVITILVSCYMILGLTFTALVAIAIGIIAGVWYLLTRKRKKRRRLINLLLILFLLIGIACLVGFSVFIIYVKSKADPKFDISKLNTLEISRIYASDGTEIAKLGSEKREKVTYEELPEVLVDAIIATEDSRFFQHNGFDAPRFLKATLGQLTKGAGAGGASTLSMQVTKNSFTDPLGQLTSGFPGIVRKFEDIYLTVFKLEKNIPKNKLLNFMLTITF